MFIKKDMEKVTVTMKGKPITLIGKTTRQGEEALMFYGMSRQMETISLEDFKNKTIVATSFLSVDIPACAVQLHRLEQIAKNLDKDVIILAISCDLPFAMERFCKIEEIRNIVMLSDYKDIDFGLKYGFLLDELRLLTRGIVIIGRDRKIKYVEYVREITQEPSYDKLLTALESLKQ